MPTCPCVVAFLEKENVDRKGTAPREPLTHTARVEADLQNEFRAKLKDKPSTTEPSQSTATAIHLLLNSTPQPRLVVPVSKNDGRNIRKRSGGRICWTKECCPVVPTESTANKAGIVSSAFKPMSLRWALIYEMGSHFSA